MGGKNTKLEWKKIPLKNPDDEENMPTCREKHTCVPFYGATKMIIYGGYTGWTNKVRSCSNETFEFNFMSKAWAKYNCTGELPAGRCFHTAVNIDEKMIVFGGVFEDKEATNELYALDIDRRVWTKLDNQGQTPSARNGHTAVVINKTKMLVYGGCTDEAKTICLGDLFEWDYETKLWTQIDVPNGPGLRVSHTANTIFDRQSQSEKMAIYAGCDGEKALLGDIVIFDYDKRAWVRNKLTTLNDMPSNRKSHTTVYWDNKLILFGGWSEGYMDVGESLNDIYSYSFASNSWEKLQIKTHSLLARYNHTCAVYEDSMILFGGFGEKLNTPGDLHECSLDGLNREWEVAWSDIEILSRVGEGQYGTVYSGYLKERSQLAQQLEFANNNDNNNEGDDEDFRKRSSSAVESPVTQKVDVSVRRGSVVNMKQQDSGKNKIKVAVKKMKLQNIPKVDFQLWIEFKKEVNLLRKLNHPNVLNFLGACLQEPNVCVLTDYMSKGSLHSILLDEKVWLPFDVKVKISIDVAKGIEYLHRQRPPILHRDLKSMNILIDDDFNAKVCDFGLARVKQTTMTLTGKQGTPLWMSPQMLSGDPSGEMCDVYSFAIVMWETFTRQLPYKGEKPFHVTAAVAKGEKRPTLPQISNEFEERFVQVMKTCWAQNPKERMCFTEIISSLEQLHTDYVNSEIYTQEQQNKPK